MDRRKTMQKMQRQRNNHHKRLDKEMNKIEKLYDKIIETEKQMYKLVQKLPEWNSNVGLDHGCSSIMYAFRASLDIQNEWLFELPLQ